MIHRPRPIRLRPVRTRFVAALAFAIAALTGCIDPNLIGVQDYGTVYGNVVDVAGKPIGGALVSATGTSSTFRSDGDGSFRLPHVSIGTQTLGISAPGYGQPATPVSIVVEKNVEQSVGNIVLPATTSAPPR